MSKCFFCLFFVLLCLKLKTWLEKGAVGCCLCRLVASFSFCMSCTYLFVFYCIICLLCGGGGGGGGLDLACICHFWSWYPLFTGGFKGHQEENHYGWGSKSLKDPHPCELPTFGIPWPHSRKMLPKSCFVLGRSICFFCFLSRPLLP